MVSEALQRRAAPRGIALATSSFAAVALFLILVAASAFIRTRALGAPFWIDEGLSVGIASFPVSEIPGVLRQDGSPPLYYVLLHGWIDVFGSSERATHALSLVFALLTVPAALWAGWSLFDRATGWVAAAFAALNPFITIYAQETRMYSLIILLSLLATATFAHAFVWRRLRYVPAFALVLAVMFYTHNWAVFFAVGAAAALVVAARESPEPGRVLRDGALAFGAAALAYAPWLPTLAYQAANTGAPWANRPSPLDLVGGFAVVFTGQGALVAVLLGGGVGVKVLLRGPASPKRTAILAIMALAAATLLAAWLFSQFTPAWANRYLGVLVGPVLLVAAAGVPRAGRLGIVALAIVFLFWASFRAHDEKMNANALADVVGGSVGPGDLILATQPEQVPLLAYYFGHDKRYATPLGPVAETRVMDWRNVLERLEAARPETTLEPLLADIPEGGRVFLVRPYIRSESAWTAPWTELVRIRSEQWPAVLAADERFVRTREHAPPYTDDVHRPLVLEIFEKERKG